MPQAPNPELAFALFRQAYEQPMRGELDEAVKLYGTPSPLGPCADFRQ